MTEQLRPDIEPWIVSALLEHVEVFSHGEPVWIPNCGQGELVRHLYNIGVEVVATDSDLSTFDAGLCDCAEINFLEAFQCMIPEGGSIICMPPPDEIEAYVTEALTYNEVFTIAMLLPSNTKNRHPELFQWSDTALQHFAYEIVLTEKPRFYFYSGDEKEAKKTPKLDYSWFVFSIDAPNNPIMFWERKPE